MTTQIKAKKERKTTFKNPESALNEFIKEFDSCSHHHNHVRVFDDFLKITICTLTRDMTNPINSLYEDEYIEIIQPYVKTNTLDHLANMLGIFLSYADVFYRSGNGNDLLGTFYEQEISRGKNGEFFTPFPLCKLMAKVTKVGVGNKNEDEAINIIDPACGSGRNLMAAKLEEFKHSETPFSKPNGYFGVDINVLCVRMTAINMLLNGMEGEVMHADTLTLDDYRGGYKIIGFPSLRLGIYKIEKEEDSSIWQFHQRQMKEAQEGKKVNQEQLIIKLKEEIKVSENQGEQLSLF